MATSGSTDYTATGTTVINGALRIVGALAQGETATAAQTSEALEALNMMLKAYQADGMPLWAIKQYSVPLTASTATYNIGEGQTVNTPKPLKVQQAFLHNTSTSLDIPMRILTRQEYNMLGNKTTAGQPIQIFYEPLNDYGVLHVFPVPTTSIVASNELVIVYQRPFEDMDAVGNTFDFPNEWLDAIKYGLADRLALEYGVPQNDRRDIMAKAIQLKTEALNFGVEQGSFYFQVEKRGW